MASKKDKAKDGLLNIMQGSQKSKPTLTIEEDKEIISDIEKYQHMDGIKKNLDVNALIPHEKNTFSMDKDSQYLTTRKSIEKHGILNPIICYPSPSEKGKYIIISGHRRRAIALELGLKRVPVNIIEKDYFENSLDELFFLGGENLGNRLPNPIDIAKYCLELEKEIKRLKLPGRVRDIIAERIPIKEMSSKTVYNYMSLLRLPEFVQDWIRAKYITQKSALELVATLENSPEKEKEQILHDIKAEGQEIAGANTSRKEKELAFIDLINKLCVLDPPAPKRKPLRQSIVPIKKRIDGLSTGNFTLPTQEKKRKETAEMIATCINELNAILSKLNESDSEQ